jgi:hypothetical protein
MKTETTFYPNECIIENLLTDIQQISSHIHKCIFKKHSTIQKQNQNRALRSWVRDVPLNCKLDCVGDRSEHFGRECTTYPWSRMGLCRWSHWALWPWVRNVSPDRGWDCLGKASKCFGPKCATYPRSRVRLHNPLSASGLVGPPIVWDSNLALGGVLSLSFIFLTCRARRLGFCCPRKIEWRTSCHMLRASFWFSCE